MIDATIPQEITLTLTHEQASVLVSICAQLQPDVPAAEVSRTELEDWLDGDTVMDMLNISERTLCTYRQKKFFGITKIGRKIYYKRADIEDLMDRNQQRKQTK